VSRVRKEPKYIGSAIRNDMEEGDELCISLGNGDYYNMQVAYTLDESGQGDREVFCGDEDAKHLGLVVDIEETEKENGYGTKVEWEVYAYTRNEDPDGRHQSRDGEASPRRPIDKYDIEALTIMGEDVRSPDMTIEEIVEEAEGSDLEVNPEEINEMVEEFHAMRDELDYVIQQAERVRQNELTLAEYENRLSAYEVMQGGDLSLDAL